MDKKTEFANLLRQLMDTKDGDAFQSVVAKNIKSITPEFLEFLDDTLDGMESESDEKMRRGAKLLGAVRESIDVALVRIRRSGKAPRKQGWFGKLTGQENKEPESWETKSKIDWASIPVPIPPSINEYYDLALKKFGYTDRQVPMSEWYRACEQGFVNSIRARLIDELTSEEMNEYRKLKTPKQQLEYLDNHLMQPDQLWNWGLYEMRKNLKKVGNMAL